MRDLDVRTLDLCRTTIDDQLRLALALARAGHFNRQAGIEHHIAVIEARWKILEGLVFSEQARIELMERESSDTERGEVWPAMNVAYEAAVKANPALMEALDNDALREAFTIGLIAVRRAGGLAGTR